MKLSICMMVKNEEKNLPRCLEKLKPLTESGLAELIIVDTGSDDESINIAKQYTNKVYFHKWNKNFSEMRNISISYASGEWIFIIDADERLDDTEKLSVLMNSSEIKKSNAILLQVKNLYNTTDESKYNLITSPRIFRNDGKFRYEGAVHNQPIFNGPNLSVDVSLTHFGYISNDKKLMELKYKRTTELLKAELEKDPYNVYYGYQLGVSYDMHEDHKEALSQFRKVYNILKKRSIEEKKIYVYIYGSYSRIAYTNGEYKETIKIAKEALSLEREYIDLYYLLGISQRQLRNKEDALKYLNKYVSLAKKYNELDISKDMSIIMYHIDDKSKSTAYFEIIKYYLESEKYEEAYKIYNNVTNINEKIYTSINILMPLKKYSELRKLYDDILSDKSVNNFLCTLEDKIKKIDEQEKNAIYEEFALSEGTYGLFNKLRITNIKNEKLSLTKLLIEEIDFDNEPLFYSEIFKNMKEDINLIINAFKTIESWKLKDIIRYLIQESKIKYGFENYILKKDKIVQELEEIKVNATIAEILMLIYIKDNDKVNEKYLEIFKIYIKLGKAFVQELYKVERAEEIYKSVKNEEDRFFIIMYIIDKVMKQNDKKSAVKYMFEAVKCYKAFSKYIDIYKNEILNLEEEKAMQEKNKQFSEYKTLVKENINKLINNNSLEEAKILIKQYEELVNDDIDMYSMKSVIAMLEGNIDEGERILNKGLKIEENNSDLLMNLSYIQSQKNNITSSVESYSKAKLFKPNHDAKVTDIITNLPVADKNKLRILNGTIEIANQMSTITKGLKNLGEDAKSLNYYPNYLGYKCDCVLDVNSFKDRNTANLETKKIAAKMLAENDVFHFHFGTTLTLDYSDLPLYKELNKKILMQYWGSDVRLYSQAKKINRFIKVKDSDEEGIKRKLNYVSNYITNCVVSDYELYEYVKDFHENVHIIPQAIDLQKYKFSTNKNKKLHIVHAPSSPEIKGTKYILSAIEKLKSKYDFEFTLVQGMAHEEAKKIYDKADLIIDQLLCGTYGLFATECMAMGKPVITWITDYMKEKYSKELPIVSANPETIEKTLEELIKNKEQLITLGKQGREYVEKYHDKDVIAKQLLELYKTI